MKRQDALRKVQAICERLDKVDPDTFFVRPLKLYLFGSVLTDKPEPNDIDLVLDYRDRPIQSTEEAIARYADIVYRRPLPFDKANRYLRGGMKMIRFFPADGGIAAWDQLPLFADPDGRQLVWKPGLNWRAVLDEIEAHPRPWPGPRPPDAQREVEEAWNALSPEEREEKIGQIMDALDRQEKEMERAFSNV